MTKLWQMFDIPWLAGLLILAMVGVIVLIALGSIQRLGLGRTVAACCCRSAIVILLVLAATGMVQRGDSSQRFVVCLVDQSASVGPAARATAKQFVDRLTATQGLHEVRVVPFGDQPSGARRATDLAKALGQGAAMIPNGYAGELVLLSDGCETVGQALRTAAGLKVPVSVVPLTAFEEPEVGIGQLRGPISAAPGERLTISVAVDANRAGRGTLRIQADQQTLAEQTVEVTAGRSWHRMRVVMPESDQAVFTAVLETFEDRHPENNRGHMAVLAAAPTRVLVVAGQLKTTQTLSDALKQDRFQVEQRPVAELPGMARELAAYDLVFLAETSLAELDDRHQQTLQAYVEQGGGLIVCGGQTLYADAAYQGSVLETIMPVAAKPVAATQTGRLAMVLVIDSSKSMETDGRLELAKQAARQSVALLGEQDQVGVIAFGNQSRWISELQTVADRRALLRQINQLQAAGKTNMAPAVAKGMLALEQADAEQRHLTLLTDGVSSPGDFSALAQALRDAGISFSAISVSEGADQTILQDMAQVAGGHHFHCDNPADIPKLVIRETQAAAQAARQISFRPFVVQPLPGLNVSDAPALSGMEPTSPKPQAQILLAGHEGDPLLCWWRYQQGVAVAYTSDISAHWSGNWLQWSGFKPFWSRLVRLAARAKHPAGVWLDVARNGDHCLVTLDAINPEGRFVNHAQVRATVDDQPPVSVPQIAPGRYAVEVPIDRTARATGVDVTLKDHAGRSFRTRRLATEPSPAEFRLGSTQTELLRSLAAGRSGLYDPTPEALWAAQRKPVSRIASWNTWLILAAAILLVVDVGIRRWSLVVGR